MKRPIAGKALFAVALLVTVVSTFTRAGTDNADDLTGAWRGKVSLTSGVFAAIKDLEFMYVFNVGGTLTESSNYDAAPPGPPAYGIWRKTGARHYETKYLVFMTKAVSILDEINKGGGWAPDGYGVLSEKITLSDNGDSYESVIKFEIFDPQGRITDKGGEGVVKGSRITF
jgi:hypothetical protein